MLALFLLLAADGIDLQKSMGAEIFAAAGLSKLSAKELGVLSRWVLVYTATQKPHAAGPPGKISDLIGGIIIASDGHVLGKISRDPMDLESIANDTGVFGRKFGAT